MNAKILEEIKKKREFSQLSEQDIELAYSQFEKRQVTEEDKIRLTKELLRKIFSAFVSKKLLSLKDKEPEWTLRKHLSTKERLSYYTEVYKKIFQNYKLARVIDLGAGINGMSYEFFSKDGVKVDYTGIESVGQLVDLVNFYFKSHKLKGEVIHLSLFEKKKVLEIIQGKKKPVFVFMFKVIDALEDLKRDYSKELLFGIASLVDKIVVSFATKSLGNRKDFKAKRSWILNFIKENFNILDEFELGGERYVVFSSSKTP